MTNKIDIVYTIILPLVFLLASVLIVLDIMNISTFGLTDPIRRALERYGFYGKRKQNDAINKQINSLIRKLNNET
tara:strand:+ start:637 stop:861 length:225 start_codon:yes stop_codon:yes gene_type:complete